jgi:hypothetical protein
MEKQRELNLIVVETAGGRSFLGDCDKNIDEANKRIYNDEKIVIFNALLLGQATMVNQQTGAPAAVPYLGTLHYSILEPVARLHIAPAYHYWVSEQSKDSQIAFLGEYKGYLKALEEARMEATSQIAKASPADMQGLERLAKQMGANEKTAMGAILQGGLNQKIRTGRVR